MAAQKSYFPIRIKAKIGEDRRLVIELPPETPTGNVEIVIQPDIESADQPDNAPSLTREEARAKLLAAGALVTWIHAPDDAVLLTPEERMKIGKLPPGTRPSEELIDEDRGDY